MAENDDKQKLLLIRFQAVDKCPGFFPNLPGFYLDLQVFGRLGLRGLKYKHRLLNRNFLICIHRGKLCLKANRFISTNEKISCTRYSKVARTKALDRIAEFSDEKIDLQLALNYMYQPKFHYD